MAYVSDMAVTLRAAGIKVKEYPGWATRGHGPLSTATPDITWHHDASPKGDSPGVADYMYKGLVNSSSPGDAQIWVDRYGVWHLLGAGRAWHAGAVLNKAWSNYYNIGIETDHTVGEDWPPAMLESLRKGTAALLKKWGKSSEHMHFHKSICSPPGRKVDPDGLNLTAERARVAAYMSGSKTSSSTATSPRSGTRPAGVADQGAIAMRYLKRGSVPTWSVARYKAVLMGAHGPAYRAYLIKKYGKQACTNTTWNAMCEEATSALYTALGRASGDKPGTGWLYGDLSTPGRALLARLGFTNIQ